MEARIREEREKRETENRIFPRVSAEERGFTIPRIVRRGVLPTQVSTRHLEGTCGCVSSMARFIPAERFEVIAVSHGRQLTRVQQMCSCPRDKRGIVRHRVFGPLGRSLPRNFFQGFPRVSFFVLSFLKLSLLVSNEI